MKAKFITLGCKVNQYETEAMREALLRGGFSEAEDGETADVVVVNSCTVTAAGDQKARQALRKARRENPGAAMVLTGCWPQAFPKEAERFTEADVVLGNSNRAALLPRVTEFLSTGRRVVDVVPHDKGEAFERLSVSGFHGRTRAFLKIEDGCDRFCSYCVIPYARGRVRSKPLNDIRAEVGELAAHGYREVVLTGVNLPAYGNDLGCTLCDAVEAACAEPGIDRVRLGSLEPEMLTKETAALLRRQEKLCPQFHLSLQSGCDATLKRMNRHYTAAEYGAIVDDLRESFENCSVTTDVMVGFPGETEEEFASSLRFVEEMGFARVHVFAYSRRPGTVAAGAPDQVANRVKEERSRRMTAAAQKGRQSFLEAQVGRTEEVLFEQAVNGNVYEGYTRNYTPVRAVSAEPLHGLILPVSIVSAGDGICCGKISKKIEFPKRVL